MMDFNHYEVIGGIAFAIGTISSIIYIIDIFRKKCEPHLFSWLIWSIMLWIGYFAQIFDNAGPASWSMLSNALSCSLITILSLKYGIKTYTKSDWIFLTLALSSIIPWVITDSPLLSVIMICLIDAIAILPTIRKSWNAPWSENVTAYFLSSLKFFIALFATINFTLITVGYPIAVIFINMSLVFICLYRRRVIIKPS